MISEEGKDAEITEVKMNSEEAIISIKSEEVHAERPITVITSTETSPLTKEKGENSTN